MSDATGSGEAGRSTTRRFRRALGLASLLGYFSIVAAMVWVIWDTDGRSLGPATLPAWLVAPAQMAPESLRHEAARAMCYVAVLVNSDIDSGPCRDVANGVEQACFAATKKTWCVDQRIALATAFWLLLGFAMLEIMRSTSSRAHRQESQTQRNEAWNTIIINGILGMMMLGSAYHTALLDDVIILDPPLRADEDWLGALSTRGCSVRSGNCLIDLSSKTPSILSFAVIGLWISGSVIRSGYRRRKDFVYRPDSGKEEKA